ncbi:Uncharacterized protein YjiK [Catalinimonas alkaloidigena]|uniref:Uncharacterized protein YjiK n=2 Tax=Catalinimonas alkaloidigena TaxID=1075417 RepID=A0A1G8WLZ8_9BACT|nr:Uncharacterized protein YjiK [Catalinimonas alkaloidigena]
MWLVGVLFLSGGATGCRHEQYAALEEAGRTPVDGHYMLRDPDRIYHLPDDLEEISGLTWWKDNQLVCVQDEDGKLFLFDTETGKVTAEHKFGKDGDYEGVEVVGDRVYVTKSNGTLYEISAWETDDPHVRTHKTFLDDDNNVEGLGYDPAADALLLACKSKPGVKADDKVRSIYRFRRATETLEEEPWRLIHYPEVIDSLKAHNWLRTTEQQFQCRPSGVAVHPLNQKLYVLASTGKLLLVFDPQGNLEAVHPLNPRRFEQPEGICFAPNGDLYISNEGDDKGPNILLFRYEARPSADQ